MFVIDKQELVIIDRHVSGYLQLSLSGDFISDIGWTGRDVLLRGIFDTGGDCVTYYDRPNAVQARE